MGKQHWPPCNGSNTEDSFSSPPTCFPPSNKTVIGGHKRLPFFANFTFGFGPSLAVATYSDLIRFEKFYNIFSPPPPNVTMKVYWKLRLILTVMVVVDLDSMEQQNSANTPPFDRSSQEILMDPKKTPRNLGTGI